MIEITELNIYPVKGLRGISLRETRLDNRGLAFDRLFMLTDSAGKFISQRSHKKLALFITELTDTELTIHFNNTSFNLPLEANADAKMNVTIWKDSLPAEELRAASAWFSEHLGEELHFVRFLETEQRRVDPVFVNDKNALVSFPDAYPILIISEESLKLLNSNLLKRGEEALPMNRFRPNMVVKNMPAFAELSSQTLSSEQGELSLQIIKPCLRCPVPSINQETAAVANAKEPLATLALINPLEKRGAFFGGNAIIKSGFHAMLRVGDRLIST